MFDLRRADWYPATARFPADVVMSSTGTPRSALRTPLGGFLVHYIGAGRFLRRRDDGQILTEIEVNHARPMEKPNEYNSGSGIAGRSCEYAGRFRAAHSSGKTNGRANNEVWWGHVVFLGHPEVPSEAEADLLIAGIRRTRRQLVDAGLLAADHEVQPHMHAPGLATGTSCPGPLFSRRDWWERITAPLGIDDGGPVGGGDPDTRASDGLIAPNEIPTSGGVPPGRAIVRPKDGWMAIAARELGDPHRWKELRDLNGGPTRVLHPGEIIVLPGPIGDRAVPT